MMKRQATKPNPAEAGYGAHQWISQTWQPRDSITDADRCTLTSVTLQA
jgi:hypothetical protein